MPSPNSSGRSFGAPALDLFERHVVRQQLGEDAALAHPPCDQLRVLTSEVEDQHLVGGGRRGGG